MTLQDRADLYRAAFPGFQPLSVVDTADRKRRLEGLWIMGNDYHVESGYYGGYPAGYLGRVMSMFPDLKKILHLFSGKVPRNNEYTRFDIQGSPDVLGDAHRISECFPCASFDMILADPPYSAEDADHYGTPMIGRGRVIRECFIVLKPGGWLIWLDQVFPMFSKNQFHLGMAIGMIKSTNHRVRAVFGFQKKEGGK